MSEGVCMHLSRGRGYSEAPEPQFDIFCPCPLIQKFRRTREGCGCPKFLAARFSGECSSPIFWQHDMLSLPFGHFPGSNSQSMH